MAYSGLTSHDAQQNRLVTIASIGLAAIDQITLRGADSVMPDAADKPRLIIIGSCVTRDALGTIPNDVSITWYQARTTIVSMVTPPCDPPLDSTPAGLSPFERRNVEFDLGKNWTEKIKISCDAVIFDFIDERFGLAAFQSSYYTNSTAHRQLIRRAPAEWILPGTPEYWILMARYLKTFCEIVSDIPNVYVNNARWATRKEGGASFDAAIMKQIDSNNMVLDTIYNALARRTQAKFVLTESDGLIAATNHRWGETPYHYDINTERLIAGRLLASIGAP